MTRNCYTRVLILAAVLLFGIGVNAHAEKNSMVRTLTVGEGGVFMIPELGAVVTKENKALTVIDVLPPDMRAEDYKRIDIKNGDQLLMLNGKKIPAVEDIETQYLDIAEGEEVKFGIRRDKQMMMISYKRGGKDVGGNMQVMKFETDGKGSGTFTQTGDNMNINLTGDVEHMHPALELGLVFGEDDNGVSILQVLPNNGNIFPAKSVQEKDMVLTLNGKSVKTLDDFRAIYKETAQGEPLEFTIQRGGDERAIAIVKPASGQMQMIKHGE